MDAGVGERLDEVLRLGLDVILSFVHGVFMAVFMAVSLVRLCPRA